MGFLHTLATWAVVVFGFLAGDSQGRNLELIVKTINRCQGINYSGLPVGFEKLTYSMTPESGNIMVNGFLVARKPVDNVYILFEISRCLSEDRTSCQHFLSLNYTDLCKEMHKKDAMWTTFVGNMKDLPESCPLPPGRYEMVQSYFDLKKIQETFKLPAGIWMGVLKFYEPNEFLSCYYIIATVKPERKRKTL